MERLGLSLPLRRTPLPEHRDRMRSLVDAGYTDLWTQETAGLDPFVPLALAAEWAPAARLGTAVAGVFQRGPAVLAMQAAALAEAAPGRFVLGIGSSSRPIVEGWNAGRLERPVARVRDTLRVLRRALAGERIDGDFETFSVRGLRLERPPGEPPPIYVAALRERMLRLAGAEADGVCLSLLAPEDVPRVLAVARGARGGRALPDVVLRLAVCPTPDIREARARARRLLAAYLSLPVYARFHAWLGRGELLRPVWDAWKAGDRRGAEAALPDALVDALFVHGSPGACRERIEAFRAAGVTTPVVALWPHGGDPWSAARALVDARS